MKLRAQSPILMTTSRRKKRKRRRKHLVSTSFVCLRASYRPILYILHSTPKMSRADHDPAPQPKKRKLNNSKPAPKAKKGSEDEDEEASLEEEEEDASASEEEAKNGTTTKKTPTGPIKKGVKASGTVEPVPVVDDEDDDE
jgi:hypothetical protein